MTAPAAASTSSAVPTRSGWDRLRLLLAVLWLVLGLSALVLHESTSSLDELYDDARSGAVDEVRLVGGPEAYGLPRGSGDVALEAHWSSGHRRHVLHVTVGAGTSRPEVHGARTRDDVGAVLRALDPSLRVRQEQFHGGWSATLLGTRLPGVVVPVLFGAGLATLLLLVNGPEPWRATRWAWFWLLPFPGAVVALCLLSGPTPGVPAPRTSRRLRGGWVFLATLLVGTGWAGTR
ncbi:MAG: hypothetical protein JWM64_1347 [Frankiales bacterium]|nr:hypothetical protein [Frankiales bacterium]